MSRRARRPGATTSPAPVTLDFVASVMTSIGSSTRPSAPRSFLDAARERSLDEAVASVVVASHLVVRGRRVPTAVRAQALALVAIVALVTGTGVTLAATTAIGVVAPVLGIGGGRQHEDPAGATIPPSTPATPAPTPPATRKPSTADEARPQQDARRRPWDHRAGRDVADPIEATTDDDDDDESDGEDAFDRDGPDGEHASGDGDGGSAGDDEDANDADHRDGATDPESTEPPAGDDGHDGGDDAEATDTPEPTSDDEGAEDPDSSGDPAGDVTDEPRTDG